VLGRRCEKERTIEVIAMSIGSESINKVDIRPFDLLDSKDNCFHTKTNYMQYSLVKTID
jgi:hypothetical protein